MSRGVSRDAALALATFVVSVALLSFGLGRGLGLDVVALGGDRILSGDWPYRDFWTLYAPGGAFAVAATFGLLGRELIALQAVTVVLAGAATAAFFLLIRTAGLGRRAALLSSVGFALAVWAPGPAFDSYVMPRLLLLLAWERVLRALRDGDPKPAFTAGVLFGVTAFFKHDVAAYAAAGSMLAFVCAGGVARRRSMRRLVAGCACAVVPALLLVAGFAGRDAWTDLIVFPASEFASVRAEAYPGWLPPLGLVADWLAQAANLRLGHRAGHAMVDWALAVTPQALMLLWAVRAIDLRARRPEGSWRREPVAAVALPVASLPFFWAAAHVQQNTHLFSMGVLGSVLAVQLWASAQRRTARVAVGVLASLLVGSLLLGTGLRFVRMQIELSGSRPLGFPGTRAIVVPAREHAVYAPIVSLIRERVPEGEAIHVSLGRHDAIVIDDARFYFLADRPPATRYHELHPGVADRAAVQREIIDALEHRAVRCVVVWNFGWPEARLDAIVAERRRKLPGIGALLLDDYLARRFERIARYGEYDVLWRREDAAPADQDRATGLPVQ